MTENSHPTFAPKWEHADKTGKDNISLLDNHLDHRKKGFSDVAITTTLLASLLAYRGGPFQVRMADIPKEYKAPLKDVLECLRGPVLLSLGDNVYEFREDYSFLRIGGKFRTIKSTVTELETSWGAIYRDGTHHELPFSSFPRFGYVRPAYVRIVAPHTHWHMFFSDEPTPSRNWQNLEETCPEWPDHEFIMEKVVEFAARSGVRFIRHGSDSFICHAPEHVAFHLDNTLIRLSGKAGNRPLLEITDSYNRISRRWGARP